MHEFKITKRIVLAGLLVVVHASGALAAAKAVVREPIVDVGSVAQGDKVEHVFVLRNEGDSTLAVREVKPACGCTVAQYDSSIAPGASGKITAVLSTEAFDGPIAKSVTVFTNDADNPQLNLVIKAVIEPHVEVEPGYARFIVVEGAGTEASTQTLAAADGPPLEIRSVRSPYPFVKVTYRRIEAADSEASKPASRDRWEVVLTLDRNRAPIGPLADHVQVETNNPKQKVVKIPVSGFVRPAVSVTPRVADLGSRRLDGPYTTSFEVRNQTDVAISVESVTASVAGVGAEFEEIEEGKVFKVVLTLNPEMAKGSFAGKLQIVTTSKRRPVLEVDLSGTVL